MNTLTIPALKTVVLYRCDCTELHNTIADRSTWTVHSRHADAQNPSDSMTSVLDDLCTEQGFEIADVTPTSVLLIHPDRSLIAFTIEAEQPR